MLNREVFDLGMKILLASYPEYQCTPETIEVYWMDLKDFDSKDFERVITNHRRTQKFFPRICELREELVQLRGFNRPTANDAWAGLIKAAESGERPEMDENIERALQVCGGWDGFSRMTYRDLQFQRKEFIQVYNAGLEREDRQLKIGQQGPEQKQIEKVG